MTSTQVERLAIAELWGATRGAGVRVALLDTGVNRSQALPAERVDAVESDGMPQPFTASAHGTFTASLIASSGARTEGIAPECRVLAVRVSGANDRFSLRRVKEGLALALEEHCDLIACSFSLPRVDDELHALVRKAHLAGVPVIAATGNDPEAEDEFPHGVPHALVVGALDVAHRPMLGRHTLWTDIFCLGDDLDVVDGSGEAVRWAGHSSGATAIVAGVVALALAPLNGERRRRAGMLVDGLAEITAIEQNELGLPTNGKLLRLAPASLFHAIQELP